MYLRTTSAELLGAAGMKLRMRVRDEVMRNKGIQMQQISLAPEEEILGLPPQMVGIRSLRSKAAVALGKPGQLARCVTLSIYLTIY